MRWWGQRAVDIREDTDSHRPEPAGRDTLSRVSGTGLPSPSLRARPVEPGAAQASLLPAAQFQLVSKSPTETVATAGDCLIVIVEQTVGTIGVNAIRRGFEQLESEYEEVGYFSYLDGPHVTAMDPKARQLMADIVRRHTSRIGAAAMVVHGSGFRSTVVRSVLTGIHLASRATHPMRAFSAVEPALSWYEEMRPRRALPASALRQALFALYAPSAEAPR